MCSSAAIRHVSTRSEASSTWRRPVDMVLLSLTMPAHADDRTLLRLATTSLGIGTCGVAVAIERGPSVDRHHATLHVPRDEQRLPDAQHKNDGLAWRLGRPPRVRR